ncbi:hypothetical protein PRZ48_010347 [Zasmidium cellare]|uniref:Uncharacterized protein n=1 Tax=Zasmidium cellare TaxID=395010 RepID=A0ABR0E8E0_ZASCE|nr:hypothetical protein PRZ48_010347 [Zasmidium cellare]
MERHRYLFASKLSHFTPSLKAAQNVQEKPSTLLSSAARAQLKTQTQENTMPNEAMSGLREQILGTPPPPALSQCLNLPDTPSPPANAKAIFYCGSDAAAAVANRSTLDIVIFAKPATVGGSMKLYQALLISTFQPGRDTRVWGRGNYGRSAQEALESLLEAMMDLAAQAVHTLALLEGPRSEGSTE